MNERNALIFEDGFVTHRTTLPSLGKVRTDVDLSAVEAMESMPGEVTGSISTHLLIGTTRCVFNLESWQQLDTLRAEWRKARRSEGQPLSGSERKQRRIRINPNPLAVERALSSQSAKEAILRVVYEDQRSATVGEKEVPQCESS